MSMKLKPFGVYISTELANVDSCRLKNAKQHCAVPIFDTIC